MPGDDRGRRILVVDDDERVRTGVAWALEAEGFTVEHAADGISALSQVRARPPALVVLDLSLPGLGGLDVLRRIRAGDTAGDGSVHGLPVIVLSGRDGETDRIVGLDLGADDYLVKPFSPGELAARVRSVLRRTAPPSSRPAAHGGDAVEVDLAAREVVVRGMPVEFTAKEFDLLGFFVEHPRKVFTRAQLLTQVWVSNAGWQGESTVTEHVHRLRQKIELQPRAPRHLRTVRGVGYRWEP
jgi:two-component system, OmpR family, phosphate regulon response regulator PhoB